jgi:hypothetical protein
MPASLSVGASVNSECGPAEAYSETTSSITLDNAMGTMNVNGYGHTYVTTTGNPPSTGHSGANVITLNFTLTDFTYAFSLTGQLAESSQCGCSASARAKLNSGSSTIFDIVASPVANLSQTGSLPPGDYVFSVILENAASGNNFGGGPSVNAHISFGLNGPPAPPPTPTPPASADVSGHVSFCSNPALPPVPSVALSLTGSGSGSTLSDGSGNYVFSSVVTGGAYTVTPTKAGLSAAANGINTVDVLAVQRHYLNVLPIPPDCRLTAADVNGDSAITTVDVIAIQRFFLGLSTGLANVGKYQFSPANRSYSDLVSDQTNQNYDALIFGDVVVPFVSP